MRRRNISDWNRKRMSAGAGITNREFILAIQKKRDAEREEKELITKNITR